MEVGVPKTYGPPSRYRRQISCPGMTVLGYGSSSHLTRHSRQSVPPPLSWYDPTIPTDGFASARLTILTIHSGKSQSSADTTLQYLLFEEMRRNALLWLAIISSNRSFR